MHSNDKTLLAKLGFSDPDKKMPVHDWACQYLAKYEVVKKIIEALSVLWKKALMDPDPREKKEDKDYELIRSIFTSTRSVGLALLYHENRLQSWVNDKDIPLSELPSLIYDNKEAVEVFIKGLSTKSRNFASAFLDSRVEFEKHLTKGEGQYRTTIGFLDLIVHYTYIVWVKSSFYLDSSGDKAVPCYYCEQRHGKCVVEVKISEVPVGDLVRQLNLYKEYVVFEKHSVLPHFVAVTAYPVSADDLKVLSSNGIAHFKLGQGFEDYCKERTDEVVVGESPEL